MLIGALQENLIVLLATDSTRAPIIRGAVDPALFSGPYRVIVARIYDYIDRFKRPPGDHLPDILSDKLESQTRGEGELYAEIVENIHRSREGVNAQYVMSQLESFVKRQSLRSIAVDFAKALQRDTEESLTEAEALLASASRQQLSVFDPGTRLSNKERALAFLDTQVSAFPTGIPELDKRNFGPTRKELWLYIADTKRGKSWALIQLAKMALLQRLRVLHITLEMSEEKCSQRYFQTLFSMSKRKETLPVTKIQKDTLGRITGFDDGRVNARLTMDDPKIHDKLARRIDKWSARLLDHIIVKEFPSGALTMHQLKAYMDNLELTEQFVPDLLILDYPDLFKLDTNNYRLDIDQLYKEARGLGQARNMAVAVVSQSHRDAAKAKKVGSYNVAEAYSKIAHADVVITYSQTEAEHKLGLARLHVAGGRNDQDRITIVISQQYGMGAYVMDSALMTGTYFEHIPKEREE